LLFHTKIGILYTLEFIQQTKISTRGWHLERVEREEREEREEMEELEEA
jgi:hypothetical protein